jgi:alginate production protein
MSYRHALLLAACCSALSAFAQGSVAEAPAAPGPTVLRPDERRAERPIAFDVLGRPVEVSLRFDPSFEQRRNFDLDSRRQRDRNIIEHELKADARWRLGNDVTAFVQGVVLAERRKSRSDGSVTRAESFERGQTWLLIDRVGGLPLSVQAGRVALIDRRAWWWDDDLDAVRLYYTPGDWRVETGLARELGRISTDARLDPEVRGVTRWFGHASRRWAPRHTLEAFWLVANDGSGPPSPGALFDDGQQDASDARLRWIGARAAGELRFESEHRLSYRADAARLSGSESLTSFTDTPDERLQAGATTTRRVGGHAWDVGGQWVLPGTLRPSINLGLANGSGGARSGSRDRNFRQTGLQENKARVAGVKRLRYYGGLLDPQLSNLRIASAGAGFRFLNNSSAELLVHRYRQRVASTTLAGSRLSQDPTGLSRDIGRELDLYFAFREWRHVELTLLLARFRPGLAFERRDAAHSFELGLALHF